MTFAAFQQSALRILNRRHGWPITLRRLLCGVAAFFSALSFGIQGNGNLIPSGFLIGFCAGLGVTALLLFGPFNVVKRLTPSRQLTLWIIAILHAVMLIIATIASINR